MSAWFKKDKQNSEGTTEFDHAVRTMEDDLGGRAPSTPSSMSPAASNQPVSLPLRNQTLSPLSVQEEKASSRETVKASGSPFLSGGDSKAPDNLPLQETSPASGRPAPGPSPWGGNSSFASASSIPDSLSHGGKKKALVIGSLAVLSLLLIGGGLYFFFMRGTKDGEIAPSVTSLPSSETTPSVDTTLSGTTETSLPRLSLTQPNFLSLDTETVTPEALRTELLKTATAVKDQNLSGAVEFLVRDQNYNPLAFSRFAYLAKLDLPSTLISQLDETFSLFVYIDQSRPRLGLSLSAKDPILFQSELAKAEKSFPQDLSPLFVDTTTAVKLGLVFKSGTYKNLATRFANVDAGMNLSIDYAVDGNQWMVGTTRDTLRGIVDKYLALPPKDLKTPLTP